jgi:monoterpene epsilon-lactone hydrolase
VRSKQMQAFVDAVQAQRSGTPPQPERGAVRLLREAADRRYAEAAVPGCVRIEAAHGARRGEWVWLAGRPAPGTVLYLHGGGYILGRPAHFRALAAGYARATGFRFFVLDYPLAPEHPYPAALDAALNAYRWLLGGARAEPVVLGGDSAGAGLAVCLLLAINAVRLPQPAAAFLLSPWVDLTLTSESMTAEPSDDPWSSRADFEMRARHYLGGNRPDDPLVSPLFAATADLASLPPLHIEVGTADRLLGDAQALAAKARQAGIEADLEVTTGAVHCFPLHVPDAPESAAAVARISAFIRRCSR